MTLHKLIPYFLLLCALLVLMGGSSCKKFVAVEAPGNQIELSKIFSNDDAAVSAAIGLYYRMNLNNLIVTNGGVTVYSGLSSDEIYNVAPHGEFDLFANNALLPGSGSALSSNLWKAAYQQIYHANAVLEGLASSSNVSEPVKRQLRGEMLVGRALNYFLLTQLFGAVPLITSTSYEVNSLMARTAAAEVDAQVIKDLSEAEGLLTAAYHSSERGRPNQFAAKALLARMYLYQQQWEKAKEKATDVINAANYSLVSNLQNVFIAGSSETIWQLKPTSSSMNTAEGLEFIPFNASTVPKHGIRNSLLNAFETGDKRRLVWVGSNNAAGQPIYYPYKYKVGHSPVLTEYYVMLRLAEMYLVRAEAQAHLNEFTAAASDLNKIRSRAGLANTTAVTKTELIAAVAHERRIELFGEWGHRWFDLKRTGMADEVLGVEKGAQWQAIDVLYPIPLSQIRINPALTQNPGY